MLQLYAFGQWSVDSTFRAVAESPVYGSNLGPLVLLDTTHNNHQVSDGLYEPLLNLLRTDGYRITYSRSAFSKKVLANYDILVIINALAGQNVDNWTLPTPSAFTPKEIRHLRIWVKEGGSLLLIADHMPFPGAVKDLADEFNIGMTNGFAIDTLTWDATIFRRHDGTLTHHPIVNGRNQEEQVDSIFTYWGHGIFPANEEEAFMKFRDGTISYYPQEAWRFNETTPISKMDGWCQGVSVEHGEGKVVVLGEAGLLTAQLSGPQKRRIGMNAREASGNIQLALNIFHWLDGTLNEKTSRPIIDID